VIPLRIEVTNFGALPYADIDLKNINLSVVCGHNGIGKSTTFTIAPRFALFGATKGGCSVDDMVRSGTQDCAVTFEFEHRGETYRASRSRSTKGRGKSTLELQKMIDERWVSESGTTIKETEEKIRALLNLDDETFTASSMILQGKANEFSAKPAGQRKAILQQILGLDIYDRLQEEARKNERTVINKIEKLKNKKSELDARLEALPQIQTDIESTKNQLKDVAADIVTAESELKVAENAVRDIEAKKVKFDEINLQVKTLDDEISAKGIEQAEQDRKLKQAADAINHEDQILAKAAEHEQAKQQIILLEVKEPQLNSLTKEREGFEIDIKTNNDKLLTLQERIKKGEVLIASLELFKKETEEYPALVKKLEELDVLSEKDATLKLRYAVAQNDFNDVSNKMHNKKNMLEAEIKSLELKAALLADSNCIDPEKAACRFLADAVEAKARLTEAQKELKELDWSECLALNKVVAGIEKEMDELDYNVSDHKATREKAKILAVKAEKVAKLASSEELLNNLREQEQDLLQTVGQLAAKKDEADKKVLALSEELKELPGLRKLLLQLEPWLKLKDELPLAKQNKELAEEKIKAIATEIEAKTLQKAGLIQDSFEVEDEIKRLPVKLGEVQGLKNTLQALNTNRDSLNSRSGALKAKLEILEQDKLDQDKLAKELRPLAKELVRWQTLYKAFGRDGIPALIIENAVPELERIANEILGQMSKGEHSLRFETQRDLKSKAGVTETLDIIVSDWAGERVYETFSGGEQLRIDFAIRFALAELLARRAGAKIEWLTVDEGLGSQDAEHRGLVLEAIKDVADRFKKTLIITHIDEAQAVFEQKILFERQGDGVSVTVE